MFGSRCTGVDGRWWYFHSNLVGSSNTQIMLPRVGAWSQKPGLHFKTQPDMVVTGQLLWQSWECLCYRVTMRTFANIPAWLGEPDTVRFRFVMVLDPIRSLQLHSTLKVYRYFIIQYFYWNLSWLGNAQSKNSILISFHNLYIEGFPVFHHKTRIAAACKSWEKPPSLLRPRSVRKFWIMWLGISVHNKDWQELVIVCGTV